MRPRIGSLCSGYGGLEIGLQAAIGGVVAWHAELDPAASRVLAHHWPDVPNLGDITTTDWNHAPRVDWLTAGYPCQPFSLAGKRKGTADERHLWPHVAHAIGVLRPGHVLLENVAGHLGLGFDRVLADLAALGYDAAWGVVRAADAGAPHQRARLFVVAADTDCVRGDRGGTCGRRQAEPAHRGDAAPDPAGVGRREGRPEPAGRGGGPAAVVGGATTDGDTTRGRFADIPDGGDPAGLNVRPVTGAVHRDRARRPAAGVHDLGRTPAVVAWGPYAPAIARWEHVTGRPAPAPTEPGTRGNRRLAAPFVEWLMGLPPGHVTAVPGLSRNDQLRCLGNGVVPQQAALAVAALLPRLTLDLGDVA